VAEDDAWVEGQSLISTVEDIELLDPDLSASGCSIACSHEPGVRVFAPLPLRAQCSCSRDAVSAMLNSFAQQDRAEMVKDGKVVVTCEFCSSVYKFTPPRSGRGVGAAIARLGKGAHGARPDRPDSLVNSVRVFAAESLDFDLQHRIGRLQLPAAASAASTVANSVLK